MAGMMLDRALRSAGQVFDEDEVVGETSIELHQTCQQRLLIHCPPAQVGRGPGLARGAAPSPASVCSSKIEIPQDLALTTKPLDDEMMMMILVVCHVRVRSKKQAVKTTRLGEPMQSRRNLCA